MQLRVFLQVFVGSWHFFDRAKRGSLSKLKFAAICGSHNGLNHGSLDFDASKSAWKVTGDKMLLSM